MDDFQKRAIGSHESRHRDKIRENAEQILEYAGYILRDLDNPARRSVVSGYAGDVLDDAQAIVTRLAMLEAMSDVTGIMATED